MSGVSSAITRYFSYYVDSARSHIINCLDRCFDPKAAAFYAELVLRGYDPNAHVDVLPQSRLIYVCIPKCASTTIKATLSALSGRRSLPFEEVHKRRYSGFRSPYQVGPSTLCNLAHDAGTLRFSFVRNPYARLVSAWADKYRNKPLVRGNSFVDKYLAYRTSSDPALPEGAGVTLSFPDFVRFTTATADRRLDAHWQLQADLLDMPGIKLDLIGKVESFDEDFAHVLAHVGAQQPLHTYNSSAHEPWPEYYSNALAESVYRAYERDFDRLRYPRAISKNHASVMRDSGRRQSVRRARQANL
jgi:hypothetical protein